MPNKIKPFDLIETIQEVPARLIIALAAPVSKIIDIILPKGTILISNTSNFNAVSDLVFVPHDKRQFDTIKNLYIHNINNAVKILGYTYCIKATDLQNNYKIVELFNYKQLQISSTSHIYLIAYLYLDGKIQTVNNAKKLCFISDWKSIEETKINFENFLLTHEEAVSIVASQIKEQIKLRQQ